MPRFFVIIGLAFLILACSGSSKPSELFTIPPWAMNSVEIEEDGKKFRFEQNEDSERWMLQTETGVFITDDEVMDSFLRTFGRPQAIPLVARRGLDLAPYGLKKPHRIIRLFPAIVEPRVLLFGDRDPNGMLYLHDTSREAVYLFDDRSIGPYGLNEKNFRDRSLLHFKADDLVAIAINSAGQERRLTKEGREWKSGSHVIKDKGLVEFLDSLRALRVKQFLEGPSKDLKLYDLDPPKKTIDLVFELGGKVSVFIGKPDVSRNATYLKTTLSPEVVLVSSDLVNRVNASWKALF